MKRKNRRNKKSTMGDALDAVKSKRKKLEASTFPADDMELYHSNLGKDAELPKVFLAGEDVQDDREASTSTAFSHSLSVKYNDSGLSNETRASTFPADDMELYHSNLGKDAELPKVFLAGEDVQDDREASTSTAFSHSLSVKYNDSGLSNETRGRIKARTIKTNREMDKMKRGTAGWEDALRQKPKKTELFQVSPAPQRKLPVEDGNNSRTGKTNQVNDENKKSKCEGTRIPNLEKKDGRIDPTLVIRTEESNEPDVGLVVWGKLGRQHWWPGIVVEGYMVLKQQAQPNTSWIFWFGDHKISQIPRDKILPFIVNFRRLFASKQTGSLFKQGVTEAIKVCAERCGCSNLDDQQLTDWAVKGFIKDELNIHENDDITTDQENPMPDFVMEMISGLRRLMKKHCEDSTSDDRDTTDRGDALDAVKSNRKKLEDICICCKDLKQEVVDQHPLFVGGLCIECKEDIIETFFAVGNDGTGMFCAVCSTGGKMFVCEDTECNTVFCLECVKLFLGEEHIEKIEQANPWLCFLCSPYLTETHGYLIPKLDYRHNVLKMFDSGYRVQDKDLNYLLHGEKKKIRVLSLFDGIGTGKVVLDKLGLDVEVYYTSEIEEDSLLVTTYHHGDTVTPLGDVTKLTEIKLKEISPIDLLIGGSPCNDLSLANPLRKGFTDLGSSAILFLDYYRVLSCLQKFSNDRHVFWLYENVASMKKEYNDVISRFLQCGPALWDAKYFSAQSRPRYFWGNIPGMYSTPDLSDIKSTSDLNDILSQKCNRKATVKIIRTVTTRQNSLKQGKNDAIFPVTMNGKDDIIWVSELERVFGFPDHYTDVGNLPVTRRRQMIGKAWSVPVVRNILNILTEFFARVKLTEKEDI